MYIQIFIKKILYTQASQKSATLAELQFCSLGHVQRVSSTRLLAADGGRVLSWSDGKSPCSKAQKPAPEALYGFVSPTRRYSDPMCTLRAGGSWVITPNSFRFELIPAIPMSKRGGIEEESKRIRKNMSCGGIRRGSQAWAASASSPIKLCPSHREMWGRQAGSAQPPRAVQVEREVCWWASSAMSCELRVAACAAHPSLLCS
jgi:hypothetical protein